MGTRKVWKFTLAEQEDQVVVLTEGAEILSAQVQHGDVQIWALVDTSKPQIERRVFFLPTGGDLPDEAVHFVATVQLFEGSIVGHVFTD